MYCKLQIHYARAGVGNKEHQHLFIDFRVSSEPACEKLFLPCVFDQDSFGKKDIDHVEEIGLSFHRLSLLITETNLYVLSA